MESHHSKIANNILKVPVFEILATLSNILIFAQGFKFSNLQQNEQGANGRISKTDWSQYFRQNQIKAKYIRTTSRSGWFIKRMSRRDTYINLELESELLVRSCSRNQVQQIYRNFLLMVASMEYREDGLDSSFLELLQHASCFPVCTGNQQVDE